MGKIEQNGELLRLFAAKLQRELLDVAKLVDEEPDQALRLTCFSAMTPVIGTMLAAEGRTKVSDAKLREIYKAFVASLIEHSRPAVSQN